MAEARIHRTGRKRWKNWHEGVNQRIADLIDLHNPPEAATPAGLRRTTAKIQEVLGEALDRGLRVRALGGGWSLSRAPTTDGWVLNTKPLNWIFPISPESLVPERAGQAGELFLVQCGSHISEINRFLETQVARSLRTTGASNGQTLAGAVATGTHGSAIDFGAIQDHVVGLHLITGPDSHVWLEPASAPVASEAFVAALGADLRRDDALFAAALVSFGSFGVIHGLMIETVPRFLLEAYRMRMDYTAGLRRALTSLEFDGVALPVPGERPYFLLMVLDPHTGERPAYVTAMYRRPFDPGHEIDYSISGGLGPGYELLGALGALTDSLPDLTPALVSRVTEMQQEPFDRPRIRTLGETFDFSTPRSKAAGAAVAVPLGRTVEALEVLGRVMDEAGPAGLIFACRFVQRSKGTLAFTRFDPTCVIDIDGVSSARTQRFLKAAWRALREAGIPHTQHWGKMNDLDAASVRRMYGADAEAWLAARRALLPDAARRRLFSSRFLEDLGLAG